MCGVNITQPSIWQHFRQGERGNNVQAHQRTRRHFRIPLAKKRLLDAPINKKTGFISWCGKTSSNCQYAQIIQHGQKTKKLQPENPDTEKAYILPFGGFASKVLLDCKIFTV